MPLGVNITVPTVTVGGGSVSASDAPTSPAATTPTTGTPGSGGSATASVVTPATTKAAWAIQSGETIFLNERLGTGPSAWVAYKAAYIFADGNAALIKEPDCVAYTGPMLVAFNLRRSGENYSDG